MPLPFAIRRPKTPSFTFQPVRTNPVYQSHSESRSVHEARCKVRLRKRSSRCDVPPAPHRTASDSAPKVAGTMRSRVRWVGHRYFSAVSWIRPSAQITLAEFHRRRVVIGQAAADDEAAGIHRHRERQRDKQIDAAITKDKGTAKSMGTLTVGRVERLSDNRFSGAS